MPKPVRPADCAIGEAALARGAWDEARVAFQGVLAAQELPEALEGLGLAAWWLDLATEVFDSRERAYTLYRERDDWASAARIAIWLAWDCWAFRGETAVASGWLQRARRLLDGHGDTPQRAWLELREGAFALFDDSDPDRAHVHATEAIRLGHTLKSIDLEMLGRALQGLSLVTSGAVAEGMRNLDEVNAAVVAGEMKDLIAIGLSCCYMIGACERVRDYDRAIQWCTRLKAFCEKWGLRPLFAVCRTQYASICMWRGTWLEAERELTAATEELASCRPAMTSGGVVRLAELRRRQGRLVEAASLFEQSEPHPLASLGRAELAFDRNDLKVAADESERYLRRLPPHNRTDRALGLDLLVRARVGLGEHEAARTAFAELSAISTLVATAPMRAAVSLAAGYIASGANDDDAARTHFEDAVDLFRQSGAPFELGRARIELARTLASLGRTDAAIEEAERAIDVLSELRAELEIARARKLIGQLPAAQAPGESKPARTSGLTPREIEVLRLVAEGLNNQIIAERLFLSEHTIHRHVANILTKLSVSSRAAAVAQAARRRILD